MGIINEESMCRPVCTRVPEEFWLCKWCVCGGVRCKCNKCYIKDHLPSDLATWRFFFQLTSPVPFLTLFSTSCVFLSFETGTHHVALTSLELKMCTRLALNSQRLCLLSAGIKGVHHLAFACNRLPFYDSMGIFSLFLKPSISHADACGFRC